MEFAFFLLPLKAGEYSLMFIGHVSPFVFAIIICLFFCIPDYLTGMNLEVLCRMHVFVAFVNFLGVKVMMLIKDFNLKIVLASPKYFH